MCCPIISRRSYRRSIISARLVLVGLWAWQISLPQLAEAQSVSQHAVGMNLSGVASYASQRMFLDAFKAARPWIHQSDDEWDTGEPLAVDGKGWVTSLAPGRYATTVIAEGQDAYPVTDYLLLYEGEGGVSVWNTASESSHAPGRIVFRNKLGESVYITLSAINPDNYIRNIRVVPLAQEMDYEKSLFYAPFIASFTQPFGVLRFMDLMNTNETPIMNWSDRSTPQTFSQGTSRGVCYEHLIALANRLHRNPWFTIPHRATDSFVKSFAKIVDAKLDPRLTVYVEYSNEVWNDAFPQAEYAQNEGVRLGLDVNDAFQARIKFHSLRTVAVTNIFKANVRPERKVVRVMGGFGASPTVNNTMLAYEGAAKKVDAIAIAPYFGHAFGDPKTADEVVARGLDDLFVRLKEEIKTSNRLQMKSHMSIAKKHGVRPIAYEGGQHLAGVFGSQNHEGLMALFMAANRDPRMEELYRIYLNNWKALGGKEFALFNYVESFTKWGSWGLHESFKKSTYKAVGVYRFMKENPDFIVSP